MSKPRLEDLPERYQAQARAQLSRVPHPVTPSPAAILAPAKPIRRPTLRQVTGDGMNRLERAFLAYLGATHTSGPIYTHGITLKIANGCRYTPDFVTVTGGGHVDAYETKGFMRDDAAVKLKVAAARFPWIAFHLVTRPKGGAWRVERIKGE